MNHYTMQLPPGTLNVRGVWEVAKQESTTVIMWRLPHETAIHILLDLHQPVTEAWNETAACPDGFVVHPYEGDPAIFKADFLTHLTGNGDKITVEISPAIDSVRINRLLDLFKQKCNNDESAAGVESSANEKLRSNLAFTIDEKTAFIEKVIKAVQAIKEHNFQKVVLSRIKQVEVPCNFDAAGIFLNLCQSYPNAFVSSYYLPANDAVWIGASPEILLKANHETIQTMSLAGTMPAFNENGELLDTDRISWSDKEYKEQRMVSDYIESCFKKHDFRNYSKNGPHVVRAGNVYHLQTDFFLHYQHDSLFDVSSKILQELHPTSAVCGMPKVEAKKFIQNHETHDRELYCGYLGPITNGKMQLYVNIRTMKIEKNMANIYVGCGITEDSIPENEFLETENKSYTLLNVMAQ